MAVLTIGGRLAVAGLARTAQGAAAGIGRAGSATAQGAAQAGTAAAESMPSQAGGFDAGLDGDAGAPAQHAPFPASGQSPLNGPAQGVADTLNELTESLRSAHGLGPGRRPADPGPDGAPHWAGGADPNNGPESLHTAREHNERPPPMPHRQAPIRRPQYRPSISYGQQMQQAPGPGGAAR